MAGAGLLAEVTVQVSSKQPSTVQLLGTLSQLNIDHPSPNASVLGVGEFFIAKPEILAAACALGQDPVVAFLLRVLTFSMHAGPFTFATSTLAAIATVAAASHVASSGTTTAAHATAAH